jgi:hypothetical protein
MRAYARRSVGSSSTTRIRPLAAGFSVPSLSIDSIPSPILSNLLIGKDDVGFYRSDRSAKAVQDKPSASPAEAFVNIDGYYAKFAHAD